MSILAENMRYLRAQLEYSQQKTADNLLITRGRYAKYEDGASEPPLEILIRISKYFHISIDLLVSVNVRKYPLDKIMKLPDNRIVLPVNVDSAGENMIEIIPHKAQMGYLSGYNDPEYIESLQNITLPFLRNGKYRAFPSSGDSMPPYGEGTYIVGKYLESLNDLKKKKTYIFITRNEGIVYKRLVEKSENSLTVASDNTFYEPYDIKYSEILEIWSYACSINTKEFEKDVLDTQVIMSTLRNIHSLVKKQNGV
ncbi:XRE family transcriptional regulator [Halpernia frigidisoli]|uniref:DNA-binding transcriptional regulator, XRE-family HTH domain n=1 Tax=Halpernia frigidisoli TaxID=1125876 RepID=A0A1I3CVZ7_9FLAO|nr:LexA family transcriptional regulator [Halpernia frigidisoli]SFH78682.1 DNA-binding transcriptional regulator, XRE-family HTH domain [Halpernia frigidisoli]